MLISRQWLSELLTPGALPSDDAALCAALTSLGLEVEGCTRHGDGLDEVLVGAWMDDASASNAGTT